MLFSFWDPVLSAGCSMDSRALSITLEPAFISVTDESLMPREEPWPQLHAPPALCPVKPECFSLLQGIPTASLPWTTSAEH